MESEWETDWPISLKLLLDKVNSMGSRIGVAVSSTYIRVPKEQMNDVNNFGKSLNNTWATIEGIQQESEVEKLSP